MSNGTYAGTLWDISIDQRKTADGSDYTVSGYFQIAEGSTSRSMTIYCTQEASPYTMYGSSACTIDGTWRPCQTSCSPPAGVKVKFGVALGGSNIDVRMDNLSLTAVKTWFDADVGSTGIAGSLTRSGGTFTVKGGGADIWGTVDGFHYVYRTLTGDGTITARVASLTNTNAYSKAVVMMRDGISADAPYLAALLTPTATNKYRLQYRTAPAATSTSVNAASDSAIPGYLRVTRAGNSFSAYHSSNGTSWTQIGTTQTITMGSSLTVGLGVTSHVSGTLATGAFDFVEVAPATDSAVYNFEASLQSWTKNGPVTSVAQSTDHAFAGTKSLKVNISGTGLADALIASPAGMAGKTVTFRVWVPSGSNIIAVKPYYMHTNWTWVENYRAIASITTNAWNTVTLPVLPGVTVQEAGVEFETSATSWTGAVYVDSVSF
jgi:hypothetical protein